MTEPADTTPPDLLPPRSVRHRAARRALTGHTAPFPVTAMLWAGAAATHGIGGGTVTVAGWAGPVIAVVWWWAWSRKRTRAERRATRWHALAVTVAAHMWLWWALTAGAGGWRAIALWAGMVALMQPYWRRRHIPTPPDPATYLHTVVADTEVVEPAVLDEVVTKWVRRVQNGDGALPGAQLTGHHEVRNGDRWDINLVPGKQTTPQAMAALPRVVSALDHLTADQVIIDRHPSGSLARAQLTVVRGHPLNQRFDHPGPEFCLREYQETGYVYTGAHPDGDLARWGFYIPDWGLAPGFLVGGIGSGKSNKMLNLATIACHTGHIEVWAACPVGGQSFPALIKHASWAATDLDEIGRQLDALCRLIQIRGMVNNLRGQSLHPATGKEPGVLLFIDEFHKLTKGHPKAKEMTLKLSTIAREGRKAAVGIIGADQDFDLDGVFGNDDTLRTNLRIKNLWLGRIPSQVTKGMISDLGVDPSTLPETFPDGKPTSGLGYIVGRRTAPSRAWYAANTEAMLAAAPKVVMETVGAKIVGDDYLSRHDRALQSKAEKAAAIGALDPDLLQEILAANPDLAGLVDQMDTQLVDAQQLLLGAQQAPPTTDGADDGLGGLPPAPEFRFEEPQPRNAREAMLHLLADGVAEKGVLIERSGYSEAAVRGALNELITEGLVAKTGHGRYTRAAVAA